LINAIKVDRAHYFFELILVLHGKVCDLIKRVTGLNEEPTKTYEPNFVLRAIH
jgi:hypothetical protein